MLKIYFNSTLLCVVYMIFVMTILSTRPICTVAGTTSKRD